MKIVPLTRDHLEVLRPDGNEMPKTTVRGLTVLNDKGAPIGVCGGYRNYDHYMAFLHATDELRASPKMLVKLCRETSKLPHRTLYAWCDYSFRGAERFLNRFGFVDRGDGIFVQEN